ncbi:1,3-beta-glucanosyltransferase gas1 [Apiotrichum porosum]|uniref:1,3-beta-glucanosyltransferase n=1 Tax=Apiotrichum porosum TaxID=105984 RepID=A0A427XJ40_9TREE|nr:1,3-beta-glucanosyltransferase gas1 [Apiotrichum porosum]RSH78803.1 1,3-beta-glucanosyltransferase gas1 [Apiotrichum porosum]
MLLSSAFTALTALLPLASALPQISRKGKYLFDPSGNRFYIKGVAYQPQGALAASSEANDANGGFPEPSSYIDPLSSGSNCTRDIPYLQQLGVNAVRVYSVNSSLNHDDCMSALDTAGIYVLLDVSLPLNGSIDRASPAWTTNLLDQYITTINKFNGYSNVLAYNVGNEVINTVNNTAAAPFVKAAARDTKAYLTSIGSKALVGYSATDGEPDFRTQLADYMTCGNDSVTIDLYGLNNYEWCGDSTYNTSGWNTIVSDFTNITVPVYMSEYGCITSPPRLWTEVAALFSTPVSDVFSGGVAFSYFPTSDGYGMVTFSSDGNTVTTSDDFTRLATQYNATSPPNSPAQSSVTATELTCPDESSSLLASTNLPPTPQESVCDCINSQALACRIIAATADSPNKIGALTDYACSLLGSSNSTVTCSSIAGDGTTGVYGQLAMCSPEIKLNYVMSAWYESNGLASSCDFDGNATLSSNMPNTADDANTAAQACLANQSTVVTPTAQSGNAPAATSTASTGSGSGTTSSSGKASAAVAVMGMPSIAVLAVTAVGVVLGAAAIVA